MLSKPKWMLSGLVSCHRQASRIAAYGFLAGLSALIAFSNHATGAVSPATRNLAVALLLELGDRVDAGGRKIQQINPNSRAELAECFAKLRIVAGQLMENEIERIRRNPYARNQTSQWAPFVALADVAHAYATGAPNIESSLSYVSLKQIEAARDAANEMLRQMGQDLSALKRQADEMIKNNLQMLLNSGAC